MEELAKASQLKEVIEEQPIQQESVIEETKAEEV